MQPNISDLESRFNQILIEGSSYNSRFQVRAENTSSSYQEADSPIRDTEEILNRKLQNPYYLLNTEQSIDLLAYCIALGDKEAEKATDRDLTICIGNTGSGKSTFVNYLLGCQMQRVSPTKLGLPKGLGNVVIVKPVKQGGSLDEIVKIGHTTQSMTFMPHVSQVQKKKGTYLCDCPGFLDNRGPEINIANATNIYKTLTSAQQVRFVILFSYNTLKADRARGLSDMIQICIKLFDSKENLLNSRESILFGMTHIPLAQVQDDEDDEVIQESIDDLKKEILGVKLNDPFETEVIAGLVENLFIYDPVESSHLRFEGALKRQELLEAIEGLTPLENPAETFKVVLTPTDKQGLVLITDAIKTKIQQILNQKNPSWDDLHTVACHFESLKKLEVIENAHVTHLLATVQSILITYFEKDIHQFDLHLKKGEITDARHLLKCIKQGLEHFDIEDQLKKTVQDLERELEKSLRRQNSLLEAEELADLEREFRDQCANKNFTKAKSLLIELEKKANKFVIDHLDIDVEHNIDIDELTKLYKTVKNKHDNDIVRYQEEYNKREAELTKKVEEQKWKDRQFAAEREREKEVREAREARTRQAQKEALEAQRRREREIDVAQQRREREAALQREAEAQRRIEIQRAQQNARGQKQILRNQLLGFGPANPLMTAMGLQLVTSSGQFHPIIWKNPMGTEIVINTRLGFFKIDPEGAVPVNMIFGEPVPIN